MNQFRQHPLLTDPKWEQLKGYVDDRDMQDVIDCIRLARSWPTTLWALCRTMLRAYEKGCIDTKIGKGERDEKEE